MLGAGDHLLREAGDVRHAVRLEHLQLFAAGGVRTAEKIINLLVVNLHVRTAQEELPRLLLPIDRSEDVAHGHRHHAGLLGAPTHGVRLSATRLPICKHGAVDALRHALNQVPHAGVVQRLRAGLHAAHAVHRVCRRRVAFLEAAAAAVVSNSVSFNIPYVASTATVASARP